MPIFDRNQGQIYNSCQELQRAKTEVERVQLVLRDQLAATYRDYVQAKNEAERLRETVLPKLQKTLDLTIKGYEQGQLNYPTVLAVQDRYLQTSLARINALTRARQIGAEIEGLQLTGGLNPAIIGTAIQEAGGGGRRRAVQQALEQPKPKPPQQLRRRRDRLEKRVAASLFNAKAQREDAKVADSFQHEICRRTRPASGCVAAVSVVSLSASAPLLIFALNPRGESFPPGGQARPLPL